MCSVTEVKRVKIKKLGPVKATSENKQTTALPILAVAVFAMQRALIPLHLFFLPSTSPALPLFLFLVFPGCWLYHTLVCAIV